MYMHLPKIFDRRAFRTRGGFKSVRKKKILSYDFLNEIFKINFFRVGWGGGE